MTLMQSQDEAKSPITHELGILQGRLSPPEDGRFQSFPRASWRQEIARARDAGLDYIEWIHDEYGRTANPIFSDAGLAEFDALKQQYGIATPALCGDWLMNFPLVRCTEEECATREKHLHELLPVAARGVPGDEVAFLKGQIEFVRQYV